MDSKEAYEKQIVDELRALPRAALAEVFRMITAVREKYRVRSGSAPGPARNGRVAHERTRRLLASSKSNWAEGLIREREDRL